MDNQSINDYSEETSDSLATEDDFDSEMESQELTNYGEVEWLEEDPHGKLQLLIELLKKEPCLYDLKNAHYKNSHYKAKIWHEIALTLNETGKL